MSEFSADVVSAIAGMKSSVDALVRGQEQLYNLVRDSHGRIAVLETQHSDFDRRVIDLERDRKTQSSELAESRGASRANRTLAFILPPIVLALWESVKGVLHIGSGGH